MKDFAPRDTIRGSGIDGYQSPPVKPPQPPHTKESGRLTRSGFGERLPVPVTYLPSSRVLDAVRYADGRFKNAGFAGGEYLQRERLLLSQGYRGSQCVSAGRAPLPQRSLWSPVDPFVDGALLRLFRRPLGGCDAPSFPILSRRHFPETTEFAGP
jgi:hypothetical protein